MIVANISPKLKNIINSAFSLYEEKSQVVIREEVREKYSNALYFYFYEVFERIEDVRFIESFYEKSTELYLSLDNNSSLCVGLIEEIMSLLDEDIEIKSEIVFNGRENSLNLIISYTLNLLKSPIRLAELDSAKLLQLINFYSRYYLNSFPTKRKLKMSDEPQSLIRERFKDIHKKKVYTAAASFIAEAEKVNEAISDSSDYFQEDFFSRPVPWPVLKQSWGGEGFSIYETCQELNNISRYLGRTEDSVSGEIELIEKYLEILKSSSFGSVETVNDLYFISGSNFFGRFNQLFASAGETASIWGLSFLAPLTKTRAFQSVSFKVEDPVGVLFKNGIKDRFEGEKLGREETKDVLPLELYINSLLNQSYKIGGQVLSLLNSLDKNDRLKNYEGLGNMKYPLIALSTIFPITLKGYDNKAIGGITGALNALLNNIKKLQLHINIGAIPGRVLEELVPWIDSIKNKIERISTIIKVTGYKAGTNIPNIPLEISGRNREDYKKYFARFGYSEDKIERILTSKGLNDLVGAFAREMSSLDAKSFMQGYDTAKLVYSIAGEAGVEAVTNYLLSPDSQGLATVFSILDVDRDQFLKLNQYKYGKLIGALYSIESAYNKTNISKIIPLLKAKNSTIGNSLKLVEALGFDSPLRSAEEIDILDLLIEQTSAGVSNQKLLLDYRCKDALKDAPVSLREWVMHIDESAGFSEKENLIGLLNKRAGITYEELSTILNMSQHPGVNFLSGVLKGSGGGDFTRILKQVYTSGLAVLMRPRKTANQKFNFEIKPGTDEVFVDLVSNLDEYSIDSQLIVYRLLVSTEDNELQNNSPEAIDYGLLTNLLNKPLGTFPTVISALGPDRSGRLPLLYNKTILERALETSEISPPPGIGNSPRFSRRFSRNRLSPEIGSLLERDPQVNLNPASGANSAVPLVKIKRDSLSKVKFSASKPINSITFDTNQSPFEDLSDSELQPDYITSQEPLFKTSIRINYAEPISDYLADLLPYTISNPITGSYFLSKPMQGVLTPDDALSRRKFHPIDSCKKFGTSDTKCLELFKDYKEVGCEEFRYNKSPLVEEEPEFAETFTPGGIPLGRPLGVSGSLNPSRRFVPNSYKAPPYFFDIETVPIAFSPTGEPIGINPEITLLGSNWNNTSTGLNFFLRTNPMPQDPLECSKYSDTNDIHRCFNLLRCRRIRRNDRPKFCLEVEL